MLDYLAIFRALNEAGVRYAVAGGTAVNLHGIPRMTYDIDLVLALEDKNLAAFVSLVEGWGFSPKIPVRISDLAVGEIRRGWIRDKNMKALNLVNERWAVSEIDVLVDPPVPIEEILARAKTFVLSGVRVPAVEIDDLIAMKRDTGRAQDAADIRHLERIKEEP